MSDKNLTIRDVILLRLMNINTRNTTHVAMDKCGRVYGYVQKPKISPHNNEWVYNSKTYHNLADIECFQIDINLYGFDSDAWKESLIEINP